ncbi:MAG: hypothetical protein JSW11_01635 [Candidatus Heimdallarchaeota archaeon]|nr:MAG: hypothetical protein JSW11_01635 [Candidatus Heimdallarchaeota archaeon]
MENREITIKLTIKQLLFITGILNAFMLKITKEKNTKSHKKSHEKVLKIKKIVRNLYAQFAVQYMKLLKKDEKSSEGKNNKCRFGEHEIKKL